MINAELLPAVVLKRKAVVYVRQSTQAQVQMNLESQRRQYDLVGEARRLGFRDIEVVDDDLGRSASGTVARPGFEKLVAWLCAGEVGAVLCLDASRLARNGRDWHHLLELCGLVEARVTASDTGQRSQVRTAANTAKSPFLGVSAGALNELPRVGT
jgi:DNA invertase Pin-like site-specific DNA recombinase